jgi:hypothetical protein
VKPSILATPFAKASGLSDQINTAAHFLVKHDTFVSVPDASVKSLQAIRVYMNNPVSNIYSKVQESDGLNQIKFLDFTGFGEDIPSVLTAEDLTVDGKYIGVTVPASFQKSWVNLTPIIGRRTSRNDAFQINDVQRLCTLVTRAMLVMSYNDAERWLTPSLASSVVEFYSMTMAAMLRRLYNLDATELRLVRVLFATYFAQLCGASDDPKEVPPLLYRCRTLGTQRDITDILDQVQDVLEVAKTKDWNLTLICTALAKYGPQRMSDFNVMKLYRPWSANAIDSMVMMFAADYPPYFVYQLLRVLGNSKNSVMLDITRMNETKMAMVKFADELVNSSALLNSVRR